MPKVYISERQRAEQLNIHVNTYLNWEKAPGKISISDSRKIAEILNVSINDIEFESRQEGT